MTLLSTGKEWDTFLYTPKQWKIIAEIRDSIDFFMFHETKSKRLRKKVSQAFSYWVHLTPAVVKSFLKAPNKMGDEFFHDLLRRPESGNLTPKEFEELKFIIQG